MADKNRLLFLIALVGLMAFGCARDKEPVPAPESATAEFERLVSYMVGSFSSREQAQLDSNYADIRMVMMRIWEHRDDGFWLYVEQAAIGQLSKPYRQRVYHLTRLDSAVYQSAIYSIPAPERFARNWQNPKPLGNLTPDSLTEKQGCALVLSTAGPKAFWGSTKAESCHSDWGGAVYTTSEVMITEREIYSWDRGFDAEGNQVWGPRGGGYVFKRNEPLAPPRVR